MNIAALKKRCLQSVIAFLGISAALAIGCLLFGSFGDTELKIILTTLTISGASVCAMSCAAFIEKQGLVPLAGIGILCSVLAAILVIAGIWIEFGHGTYWRFAITLIIASVAFAHGCLLCLPTLAARFRWSQVAVVLTDILLAIMINIAVWAEINEDSYYRFMGVILVVAVLLTLLIPIFAKIAPATAASKTSLTLFPKENDVYVDQAGQSYRVTRL